MPYKDPEAERAYRRKRYHANLEERRKRNRLDSILFRQRHPQKIQAQNASYRARHLESLRERSRLEQAKRRKEDPEHARTLLRAFHAKNPEKRSIYNARHRQGHAEENRTHVRRWRLANPDKVRTHNKAMKAQRRMQHNEAPRNDLTHAQWVEMQERQDHRCYYCKKRHKGHLTQDHLTPLSKGGSHTLHNVIAVCQSCNSRKGTRPPPIPVQPLLLTIAPAKKKKKVS